MYTDIQGVPELILQTWSGSRGHHKDSELSWKKWSQLSF